MQELAADGNDVQEQVRLAVRAIERARADIRDTNFAVDQHRPSSSVARRQWGLGRPFIVTEAQAILAAQRKLRDESDAAAAKLKRVITLSEWRTLTPAEQEAACRVRNPKAKLNSQDNDSIGWASWSWNPITGCQHDCPYCYARDLAERFYPQKFEPSLVPEALSAPLNQRLPKDVNDNVAYRNVFTCSMADMFGGWVPREWIEAVLGVARQVPHWNFLMLTKFPSRLTEFESRQRVGGRDRGLPGAGGGHRAGHARGQGQREVALPRATARTDHV